MDDSGTRRLERLVIIDGDCSFCNGFAKLSIALLKEESVAFVASGSGLGKKLLHHLGLPATPSTVYVIKQGAILDKSSAIFDLCLCFRRPYRWLRVFAVLPKGFRDWVYDLVARLRRYLPGKGLALRTLTMKQQKYLIDDDRYDWAEVEDLLKLWTNSNIR